MEYSISFCFCFVSGVENTRALVVGDWEVRRRNGGEEGWMFCSCDGVCVDSLRYSYLVFLNTRRTGVEGEGLQHGGLISERNPRL
jgi:hypothetical protein